MNTNSRERTILTICNLINNLNNAHEICSFEKTQVLQLTSHTRIVSETFRNIMQGDIHDAKCLLIW